MCGVCVWCVWVSVTCVVHACGTLVRMCMYVCVCVRVCVCVCVCVRVCVAGGSEELVRSSRGLFVSCLVSTHFHHGNAGLIANDPPRNR